MKIALDVLGGDNAPMANIEGAISFLQRQDNCDTELILVGNESIIEPTLANHTENFSNIQIIHTTESIGMEEKPSRIFKEKPNSSLIKSIELIKTGKADAVVSAGNTGALLAASLFLIGKIPGIKRPALAPLIPTSNGNFILCDAGANANSKSHHLVQFALMAVAYMEHLENRNNPRVALLNIGKEENKGNELAIATYPMLKQYVNNFIGNIESRDILEGNADVIICDGFTGNIVLKLTEGLISHLIDWIQNIYQTHSININQSTEFLSILKEIQNSLDHEEYGATPLLGINGIVMKCHGSSTARGITNSLLSAKKAVGKNLIMDIANRLSKHQNIIENNNRIDEKNPV